MISRPVLGAAAGVAALAVWLPQSVPGAPPAADARPPAAGTAHAAAAAGPIRLKLGGTAFVTGPGSARNACPAGRCWEYVLDVARGGTRLRLGVDHVLVGDMFSVEVRDPRGDETTFGPGESLYSAEERFDRPVAGRWRVRVVAESAQDERFRLRAKLEAGPPRFAAGPVLPNLQVLPPYDFTFMAPLTNGSTGGAPRGGPAVGGVASCHAEEVAEERAVRCLRMAFGVRNTGQGPMQLYYGSGAQGADLPLFQRVRYANGRHADRAAGLARWHATHGHYHHHEAVELRLWRVTDRTRGTLEAATPARRKGFAHRDELLREWTRFHPVWDSFGFGLLAGWGDYYEWDRPGNFLDLGTSPDGWYVVRMTADPGNGIAESNERDNTGYTYFRLTGHVVETIESGRGLSPWDRCKIVMPVGAEFAPKSRPRAPRPRDCPPDTT